jgi:hypothetical protein
LKISQAQSQSINFNGGGFGGPGYGGGYGGELCIIFKKKIINILMLSMY